MATNKPRNSEINNSMRRSFSGNPWSKPSIITNHSHGLNPNTPANSPSDFMRRSSGGRENVIVSFRDSEEKENSKQCKVARSPASSKSSKHFMSPTISAASKINPSPRKKVLTERNELPLRGSISFSDCKSVSKEGDCDTKSEKGSTNNKKEVSFDPTVTYLDDLRSDENADPTVTCLDDLRSDENADTVVHSQDDLVWSTDSVVSLANDCVNLDPSFHISPRTSCPLLPIPVDMSPLDADPSMPPYDYKTNYLSPRPQFLRYKPNPRVEQYRNKLRNGEQLEDLFASESSSSAEITDEETQSDGSQKEPEDVTSGIVEKVKDEEVLEEKVVEEELPVSEINAIDVSELAVAAKKVSKPNFFTRTKFTALLFVLAVACLWASVSNSPVMEPSVMNNLRFSNPYVPPEISKFTRDNLQGLSQKLRQWLYDCLSYIHNMIISFRERKKPIQFQFANLSFSIEDDSAEKNFLLVAHSTTFRYESNELGPMEAEIADDQEVQPSDSEMNIEEVAAEMDQTAEANESYDQFEVEEVIADDHLPVAVSEMEEVATPHVEVIESGNAAMEVTESGNAEMEAPQEMIETADEISEKQSNTDIIAEVVPQVSDSKQSVAETDITSAAIGSVESEAESKSSQSAVFSAGISFLVLSLLAAIAFIHMKNRTSTTPKSATTAMNKLPLAKKLDCGSLAQSLAFQERPPLSQNIHTEVETIGESCPTETSSYQYSSSSYSKEDQKGITSEVQSQEQKPKRSSTRRESMASSDCSMGSPSYGSFTTYEKLVSKHGEEEFVTPVRRSSRLRQVTSP